MGEKRALLFEISQHLSRFSGEIKYYDSVLELKKDYPKLKKMNLDLKGLRILLESLEKGIPLQEMKAPPSRSLEKRKKDSPSEIGENLP